MIFTVISELIQYTTSRNSGGIFVQMPLIQVIVPQVMSLKEQLGDPSKVMHSHSFSYLAFLVQCLDQRMVCHIIELICWSDAIYLSCAPFVKTCVPFYFIIWFLSALSVLIVDFEIHFCVDCCFYYCTLLLIENHKLPLVFLSG